MTTEATAAAETTESIVAPEAADTAAAPAAADAPAAEETKVSLDIGAEETEADAVTEEAEHDGSPVQYRETGDVGLDMALGFIGKLGIAPTDPAIKAAQEGDFSYIKAKLASYGDKASGWEQFVSLAERAYGTAQASAKEATEKTRAAVEGAVGGAENWASIQQWAAANADDGERAEINGLLSQGGHAAAAAATYLAHLYGQANGAAEQDRNPRNAVKDTATSNAGSGGALSAAQYADEVRKLSARIGSTNVDSSPEYAALRNRRLAYRG